MPPAAASDPARGSPPQVTCMHGLHLLAPQQALREAHRILKPGSTLAVAWNDRQAPGRRALGGRVVQ